MKDLNRAGWILVGGRSVRMGRDKALLEIDGRPLALRVADQIARVCGPVTLVGDPERYAQLGLPVVADEFAGAGPLSGIETALRCAASDWNLVVACDMPALDTTLLESLFGGTSDDEADCTLPQYGDGQVEPLCAVYHRRCHAAIRAALESGIRKVTDALREPVRLRYLRAPSRAPFANLNTPEELRTYKDG